MAGVTTSAFKPTVRSNPLRRTAVAAAASLALAAAAPAAAQRPAAPRWAVDWGTPHCTLVRLPADGSPALFALRTIPGSATLDLFFLLEPAARSRLSRGAAVVLMPEATRIEVEPAGRASRGTVPLAAHAGADILDRLERSTAVRLVSGGGTLAEVALPSARGAVAELRRCIDAQLRDWGIDPSALAALRQRPEPAPGANWIGDDDYPDGALRRRASGMVVMRLDVDAQGRVANCAIVASSGHRDLDETACRLLRRRGQYRPATGPDGRPAAAPLIARVAWILPGS